MKNTMMKDAIDGETSEEKEKDQLARFAKTKSLLSCGPGTDSQQQEKVEVEKWLESKESKESNGYERKSTFKSFQRNAKKQWKGVDSFDFERDKVEKWVCYWFSHWRTKRVYFVVSKQKCVF